MDASSTRTTTYRIARIEGSICLRKYKSKQIEMYICITFLPIRSRNYVVHLKVLTEVITYLYNNNYINNIIMIRFSC